MAFKKGQSGNPGGRGKDGLHGNGQRSAAKLRAEIFEHAFKKVPPRSDDIRGGERKANLRVQLALTRLYRDDPKAYLDVITRLMPKEIDLGAEINVGMDTWNGLLEFASKLQEGNPDEQKGQDNS